jgi:hypothetical protein
MEMTEFKAVIGIWLLAQIFIIPFIFIDIDGNKKDGFVMDFGALVLLIVMYFALKLMGV